MTIPETGLPTLCYIHTMMIHCRTLTGSLSRKPPGSKLKKKENLIEDIKLKVAEVRRRIELMEEDGEEIQTLVDKARDR